MKVLDKMKNKFEGFVKNVPAPVILGLIILIAVTRLCFLYTKRDGHHVDETWSYGFANSYYSAQIYDSPDGEGQGNIGKWLTGDDFNDYLSVSEDHRFAFDSVIQNSKYDLSPPLYILVLHFICSLFPGQFSWGFAFAISLLTFIPTLILLYLVSYGLMDSKLCGFICVLYYAFTGCGTCNFLYLRVYNLFTFFTVLLFWMVQRILKDDSLKRIFYILLPLPTVLGALTHLYFLVLAFGFTFFGALLLLFRKRFADFIKLCSVMLLSVIIFFALYPPALSLIMPSDGGYSEVTGYHSYPYSWDLRIAIIRFFNGTVGLYADITVFDLILALGGIVLAVILCLLIWFVFRNETWMKSFLSKLRTFMSKAYIVIKKYISQFDLSILVALFTTLFYLFVIPYSAMFVNMGFTERYLFAAMTVFVAVYVSLIFGGFRIINSLISNKKIFVAVSGVLCILFILLNIHSNKLTANFRFDYMAEKELLNELIDKDCYVIVDQYRDMTWLSSVLYKSDDVIVEMNDRIVADDYISPEFDSDTVIAIVDSGFLSEEQEKELEEKSEFDIEGYFDRDMLMTLDKFIECLEEKTGYSYEYIENYYTFVGNVKLYKVVDSAN